MFTNKCYHLFINGDNVYHIKVFCNAYVIKETYHRGMHKVIYKRK